MSAMRPSSENAAGANSQPPVTFGKPGDVEAGRAVVGVQEAEARCRRRPGWSVEPESTLAMSEAERNWKSSVIRGKAGSGAPVVAS